MLAVFKILGMICWQPFFKGLDVVNFSTFVNSIRTKLICKMKFEYLDLLFLIPKKMQRHILLQVIKLH